MSKLRYEYEPGYCGELITSNGETVCTFTDEPNKANARRLLACWNACDGVSTENLEANDSVKALADNYNAIKAQRDELLGALKGLLEVADFISENVPGAGWRMAQHKARAVINKAEGKV